MKTNARQYARAFVELTADLAGHELEDAVSAFVAYLQERHAMQTWRDIARQIDFVWRERYGVANVSVVSAHPLTIAAKAALEKASQGAEFASSVDPELIGGAIVRIDDRIVDASVSGHLQRLKTALTH